MKRVLVLGNEDVYSEKLSYGSIGSVFCEIDEGKVFFTTFPPQLRHTR